MPSLAFSLEEYHGCLARVRRVMTERLVMSCFMCRRDGLRQSAEDVNSMPPERSSELDLCNITCYSALHPMENLAELLQGLGLWACEDWHRA